MKLEGTLESTRQLAEKIVYCSNKGDWFTAHSLLLRHALVTNVRHNYLGFDFPFLLLAFIVKKKSMHTNTVQNYSLNSKNKLF